MDNVIFLYSKDAMSTEYIPIYSKNEKYSKTPNVDALAEKGTVFLHHHTAGGSTAMAFSAMLSGKNPYEFEKRKTYTEVEQNEKESIFSILQGKGYECHVIWSPDYVTGAYPYVKEFGDESKTKFHVLDMYQPLGYKPHSGELKRDDNALDTAIKTILNELDTIDTEKKQFIWLHLPHVIKGRICYGDDIDAFDFILGKIREKFGDDSIYVTADHGNMNMHKGKVGYGFDVYDPVTRVPLITPRINNLALCDSLTSHTDLIDIIVNKSIPEHEYVLCDTAYYAQPQRKLAIITKRFKYIYNNETKTEELYDLEWDRLEEYNIFKKKYVEKNRMSDVVYSELYYYPFTDEANTAGERLREIKSQIWRKPSFFEGTVIKCRRKLGLLKRFIQSKMMR